MGCARFCDVKKVSEKNLLTSLVSLADISKLTIKDKASDKARIVEFVNFLLKDGKIEMLFCKISDKYRCHC